MPPSASSVMPRATREKLVAQPLCLGGEKHPHLAPVVVAANAPNQASPFHAAQRNNGGRLHHADAGR